MDINKQILEAVNRGIQLALDDYEDMEDNKSISQQSDIIDVKDVIKNKIEKDKFDNTIKHLFEVKLTKNDLIDLAQLSNKYGFQYQFSNKDVLKKVITYIATIDANADLNWIDVSNMFDMSWLFSDEKVTTNFDISKWDVSNVQSMRTMFSGCTGFNCDISNWDVSKVKDMGWMFHGCLSFDQDLSKWDVSNVENMDQMFYKSKMSHNISNWDVSNVKSHFCFANDITVFPIFCRPKFNRNNEKL